MNEINQTNQMNQTDQVPLFPSKGEALENRVRALTLKPLRSRLTGNIGGELWN